MRAKAARVRGILLGILALTLVGTLFVSCGKHDPSGEDDMVHIGIDSVKLGGRGINIFVSTGQKIDAGTEIAKFDKMLFDKEGIDDTVVVILLNSDEYSSTSSAADMFLLRFHSWRLATYPFPNGPAPTLTSRRQAPGC